MRIAWVVGRLRRECTNSAHSDWALSTLVHLLLYCSHLEHHVLYLQLCCICDYSVHYILVQSSLLCWSSSRSKAANALIAFLLAAFKFSGYPLPGYISREASRCLVLSDELVQLGNKNLRRNISVLHCDLSKNSFRLTDFVCYSIWIFTFNSFLSIPEEAILGVFIELGTGTSNTK